MTDAAVAERPETKRREVVLVESRLGYASHKRQDWVVEAAEGTTVEDVLEPSYWAHVASKFYDRDRIEVRLETGEWLLDLIVIGAGRNWLRVHLAARHDLAEAPNDMPASAIKHKAVYKGTHKRWIVLRLSDSAEISSGHATKEMADEALRNHERVVGT